MKSGIRRAVPYVIRNHFLEEFLSEGALLKDCERNRCQALKIQLADGFSFREISEEIARIHFDTFLSRNSWLREEIHFNS